MPLNLVWKGLCAVLKRMLLVYELAGANVIVGMELRVSVLPFLCVSS